MKINYFWWLLFLLFFVQSCENDSNVKKKLDTWTRRLCCKSDFSQIKINEFRIVDNNKIEISFCKEFNLLDGLRVGLLQVDEKNGYKSIFDFFSKEKIPQKVLIELGKDLPGFKGEFDPNHEFSKGKYRLSLYSNDSCGEILFKVKSRNKIKKEFLCVTFCE